MIVQGRSARSNSPGRERWGHTLDTREKAIVVGLYDGVVFASVENLTGTPGSILCLERSVECDEGDRFIDVPGCLPPPRPASRWHLDQPSQVDAEQYGTYFSVSSVRTRPSSASTAIFSNFCSNCKRTEAPPTILGIKTGVTTKHKRRGRRFRGIRDEMGGGEPLLEELLDVGGDGLGLGDPGYVPAVSTTQVRERMVRTIRSAGQRCRTGRRGTSYMAQVPQSQLFLSRPRPHSLEVPFDARESEDTALLVLKVLVDTVSYLASVPCAQIISHLLKMTHGDAPSPLTSILLIKGNVTPWFNWQNSALSNEYPHQLPIFDFQSPSWGTYIEASLPGSWPPNWLQGKPRMTRPWSLYFL